MKPVFSWKDRQGAISQAVTYVRVKKYSDDYTTNLVESCKSVLGIYGGRWDDYFCLNIEYMTNRQFNGFVRDVKRSVNGVKRK